MGDDGYGELTLELLGSWRLCRDAVALRVATRQQRLVAALAIRGPSLRSYIAGLLWPEHPDARSLESLRVSVHLVSRQVHGLIVNAGAKLSLNDGVDVDLHRIRARIESMSRAGTNQDDVSSVHHVHELRGAEVLPGWYEDWVILEQCRLRQDRLRAFTIVSRQSLAQGDHDAAGAAAEAALELEPLYENAVQLLIASQLQQGRPAAALRTYQRYRDKLEEEMGLQPSVAVDRLLADTLGGQVIAAKDRLSAAGNSWLVDQPFPHYS